MPKIFLKSILEKMIPFTFSSVHLSLHRGNSKNPGECVMSQCLLKCRSLCTNQSQTVIAKLMSTAMATKGLRKRGWQESNITNSQHKILGATVQCNKPRLFNCISGTISSPPNHSASCCLHNNVLIKTKQNPFSVAAVLHVEVKRGKQFH